MNDLGPCTVGYLSAATWRFARIPWNCLLVTAVALASATSTTILANPGGTLAFTRVDAGPLTAGRDGSYSAAWGDFDGDGRPDPYISTVGLTPPNLYPVPPAFFRNTPAGFEPVTAPPIGTDLAGRSGVAWVDIDNDGRLDVLVTTVESPDLLYRNLGDGTFASIRGDFLNAGTLSQSAAAADIDNDGLVDLFIPKGGGAQQAPNVLLRNRGGGAFERVRGDPVTEEIRFTSGAAFGDYDGDGFMDLIVLNIWGEANSLFRNRGNGSFERVEGGAVAGESEHLSGNSAAWADYDNDGDLDLLVSHGVPFNLLYRNDGHGEFIRIREGPIASEGGETVGAVWVDFNNDGWLDLLLANRTGANRLYRGLGGGAFESVFVDTLSNRPTGANGVAAADYDLDGDVDVLLDNWLQQATPSLYRNDTAGNHWLRVRLRGVTSNRFGVGAKVRLLATIRGQTFWQMRQIGGEDSFGSQELLAHFGLGDASLATTLRIEWPSGIVQELAGVAANQVLEVTESGNAVQALAPLTLNPQTGLYEHKIRVARRAGQPGEVLRLTVSGLPTGVRLANALGTADGLPYVHLPAVPGPIDLVLTYADPSRRLAMPPEYRDTYGTWDPPVPPSGERFAIDRTLRLPSTGALLIEFTAEPGASYAIEYSEDMVTWRAAQGALVAGGSRVQWLDLGPPSTVSLPTEGAQRFYRVVRLAQP